MESIVGQERGYYEVSLDPAIQTCRFWSQWKAAVQAHPEYRRATDKWGYMVEMEALVFNRCTGRGKAEGLSETSICRAVLR